MLRKLVVSSLLAVSLLGSSGCSSLGLTLWPAQFPLLKQTKEFAANSPLPSGLPHELAKVVLPEYYIEPGDRVLIEPNELDSQFRTIGDQRVQVDGSIDLGQFGRIRVAGMTVETIESAIEDRIEQIIQVREAVNVQLVETNAAQVYVLGEVGSPGSYMLDGNETVLDAIVLAGGLTSTASPCDIILVRPTHPNACRIVLRVCYRQITQLGDVTTNYQLEPGDRVVVGARTLCEELAFWNQTTACECCNRSRCVECNPASVRYTSRFASWLAPFVRPRNGSSESEESILPHQPLDSMPDDSDIFLPVDPPANAGGDSAGSTAPGQLSQQASTRR